MMLRMVAGDSESPSLRVMRARADRLAGLDIAFDDSAEDLARALVQLG